jgi:hypothetical protein
MFEHLKQKKILVSGPQRSGTRICAKMIAHDTGLPYVDETEVPELFTGKSINDKNQDWGEIGWQVAATIQEMIDATCEFSEFVLHCPPFMPWLHYVKGAMVVVMQRPVDEIVRSAKRIDWKKKRQELEYNKMGYTRFVRRPKQGLIKTDRPIAELKYLFWESQKASIPEHLVVEYHNLRHHPLWVPPTERTNFKWNQTSL